MSFRCHTGSLDITFSPEILSFLLFQFTFCYHLLGLTRYYRMQKLTSKKQGYSRQRSHHFHLQILLYFVCLSSDLLHHSQIIFGISAFTNCPLKKFLPSKLETISLMCERLCCIYNEGQGQLTSLGTSRKLPSTAGEAAHRKGNSYYSTVSNPVFSLLHLLIVFIDF